MNLINRPQDRLRGSATWLAKALKVEEAQIMLAIDACQANTSGMENQQLSIARRRDQLQSQLDGLVVSAARFLGKDWEDEMLTETALDIPQDYEIENPFVLPTQGNVESILPPLPSYIRVDQLQELGLEILVDQELSLRQGQANDCLHEIRLALADKSMIFQQDVRHARNYNLMTRAWGRIASMDLTLNWHASLYRRCHWQMAALGTDADIVIWYQELHALDLSVTTAISNPNARGHRDDRLAWFWTMDVPHYTDRNDWMSEFYRVHWFRLKALLDQWEEEVELLQCEANWTQKYFQHRVNFWKDQQDEAVQLKNTGMACYAAQQCQIYHQLYLM
ncbi:hypothetical protein SCLCIDRAFT_1163641 [Scleroderma citrinum Foug A]|uniref:Uncharacterized protein n=1 Tax=Scleroderma citrinum Foug A TaxID=1036808 RepID=A0A0C3AJJ7_9AGAM|nr:hypothetical protein SCLCIDRAFT_1163641 [Scleroderma citrinum Foug A]